MACEFALLWAAQLVVEIDGPPLLFPPAEPAAPSRICAASRHLHRHYRMRRKRRAARGRPPSGGPQFNVKTLARLRKPSGSLSYFEHNERRVRDRISNSAAQC